jgi:apolipoprotein D and lipocalin family protein
VSIFTKTLLTILSPLYLLACATAQPNTVRKVDLKQYQGTWYEIASIPQRFSKGCVCTRAVYSPHRKQHKIKVFNSCNKNGVNGKLSTVNGVAVIKDETTNAKLRVTFFWPFGGAYWIIGLAEDYRYAVVSNKEGSTLWILSRTPQMSADDLLEALSIAAKNGIDTNKLSYTKQVGCQYPSVPN